jgi:hypothetical protein
MGLDFVEQKRDAQNPLIWAEVGGIFAQIEFLELFIQVL